MGAGTAGLEAACTAAEVGCKVTLLEKEKEAGGLSVEISKIPCEEETCGFPDLSEIPCIKTSESDNQNRSRCNGR